MKILGILATIFISIVALGATFLNNNNMTAKESIYDIFYGEKMEEYRKFDDFEHCSKCELKNFCRGCPAVAKCLTGNFYSKDPQCWKTF